MITSAVCVILIGTLPHVPVLAAPVQHEPIKITVNENFNTQPGLVIQGMQSPIHGYVHQGANFYFNPRVYFPPRYFPDKIDTLGSPIHKKLEIPFERNVDIAKPFNQITNANQAELIAERDKSTVIRQSFTPPEKEVFYEEIALPEVLVLTPNEIIDENLEDSVSSQPIIIIDHNAKPLTTGPSNFSGATILSSLSVDANTIADNKEPETKPVISEASKMEIVQEKCDEMPPLLQPIVVNHQTKPFTQELMIIPEAPTLPPLSFDDVPTINIEEPEVNEPVISEISRPIQNEVIEEERFDVLLPPQVIVAIDHEVKPLAPQLTVIPEAPILPPISVDIIPQVVKEEPIILEVPRPIKVEVIKEEKVELPPPPQSIVVDHQTKPLTPELMVIPEAPSLPPLSFDDVPAINIKGPEINEPIISEVSRPIQNEVIEEERFDVPLPPQAIVTINHEVKPLVPQLSVIPEAPILPPISVDIIPQVAKEENKFEELIIPELSRPTEVEVIKEEKVELPPPPQSIVVDHQTKPLTPELMVIPEAPTLPPLSFDDVPAINIEEPEINEPIISEVSRTIQNEVIEEERFDVPLPPQAIVTINHEVKPLVPQLSVIPEAPILPPISVDIIPQVAKEENKFEEPIIPELSRPTEVEVIKEEKVELPPPPQSIVVDHQTKPLTPELMVIPEAPTLPPLSFDDVPAINIEEPEINEPVISEVSRPIQNKVTEEERFDVPLPPQVIVTIDHEVKPLAPQLSVIPEAPILPPISVDIIPQVEKEEHKFEELIIPEVPRPIQVELIKEEKVELPPPPQSIVVDHQTKPLTPELMVIPEAPTLPPLSFDDVPAINIEEPEINEPIISEVSRPIQNEVIEEERFDVPLPPQVIVAIDHEVKPLAPQLTVIPEAPILPPISVDIIPQVAKEHKFEKPIIPEVPRPIQVELIKEEKVELPPPPQSIVVDHQTKPLIPGLMVIPEAPTLPPLSFDDVPAINIEEPEINEPVISEVSRPIQNKVTEEERFDVPLPPQVIVTIDHEVKPLAPQLSVIPEAPILPPISVDIIPQVEKEEHKFEELIIPEVPRPIQVELIKEEKVELPPPPQSIVVDHQTKPLIPGLMVIPEAPTLPPLSFDDVPAINIEEPEINEPVISEVSRPIQNKVTEEERFDVPLPPQVIVTIDHEVKPLAPQLSVIPEAPILPPISVDIIPQVEKEEHKFEELIIPEVPRPIQVELIKEEKVELPPPPQSIVVDHQTKPLIPGLIVIPEAPTLPPLSFDAVPAINIEDPDITEPPISEVSRPIQNEVIEEERFDVSLPPEPIVTIDHKSKPLTPHLTVIPEAPILPPISVDVSPQMVIEEPKIEEERFDIPAPPQSIVTTNQEVKPLTSQLTAIPEVQSNSVYMIPQVLKEEPEIEELIISGASKPIQVKVIKEDIVEVPPSPQSIGFDHHKPLLPKLMVIPEAPILPPLSFDAIQDVIIKEPEIEEPVILELSKPNQIELIEKEIFNLPPHFQPMMGINEGALNLSPLLSGHLPTIDIEPHISKPIRTEVIETKNLKEQWPSQPQLIIFEEPIPPVTNLPVFSETPLLSPVLFDASLPTIRERPNIQQSLTSEKYFEIFPSIQEISPGPVRIPEKTNSFDVLLPITSQLSSSVPTIKKEILITKDKPHLLLQKFKNQPFRLPLPLLPFSNNPIKVIKTPRVEKSPFLHSISRSHNIVKGML